MQITVSTEELVSYEEALRQWLVDQYKQCAVADFSPMYNAPVASFDVQKMDEWAKEHPRPRLIPTV